MSLNPAQFSTRDRTLPGMPLPLAERPKPRFEEGPAPKRWSGPDHGQLAMGVHDLGRDTYEMDKHGFAFESQQIQDGRGTPRRGGGVARLEKNIALADRESRGGNGVPAINFYHAVGGKFADDHETQDFWKSHPLHQVRADAIVHTAQPVEDTERGRAPALSAQFEGRERINKIRESLDAGEGIREPAWLMKHNNRLYSLDGHHRIVAAREAGLSHFPARVWDRDAEQKNA